MKATKTCSICNIEKEISEFSTKTKVSGGKKYTAYECKSCSRERWKEYYLRNKDKIISRQKELQKINGASKATLHSRKLRKEVIEFLGGKCVNCGFDDVRALQIDHIYGKGRIDRIKHKNYTAFYNHILNADSVEYQLLCANCNWIKRCENNENN